MEIVFGFGGISPAVAVILLVVALIVFGPGKLPDIGKALGKGIKEFKSATEDLTESTSEESKSDSK